MQGNDYMSEQEAIEFPQSVLEETEIKTARRLIRIELAELCGYIDQPQKAQQQQLRLMILDR